MECKEFIYIIQGSAEGARCKIGITNDLERRLKEYNSTTGRSQDNIFQYLFTAAVKDMRKMELDIKNAFSHLREEKNREIYFCNEAILQMYIDFIKAHENFIIQVHCKTKEKQKVKTIKNSIPSLKDREMTQGDMVRRAKRVKDDEFYTRLEDIEKEIACYNPKIWKDKCVFCNCDDAVGDKRNENDTSPFALFFLKRFNQLGLKKLICTHYGGVVDLFNTGTGNKGYIFTREGMHEMIELPSNYDGSFDHPISLKILNEEADIVCTNPPFSRARDYWDILIKSKKKFLIISNITNATNTSYLPYFAKGKVWAGFNRVDYFLNPKKQLVEAAGHWFCNFPIKNRPKIKHLKFMPLDEIPYDFKKNDDIGTLLVKQSYIPTDYDKPFAVSVRQILNGVLECGYKIAQTTQYIPYINGERQFSYILIQKQ